MPQPLSFGQVSAGLTTGTASSGRPQPDTPFRIGILGDFSARAGRTGPPLAGRRPVLVDRDNVEQVLQKFGIELQIPVGKEAATVKIPIAELDDFHPDRLFQCVEIFQALRALRTRLSNAATFEAAAGEMRAWRTAAAPVTPSPAAPSSPTVGRHDLLEQMLEAKPTPPQPRVHIPGVGDLQAYIQKIVQPHLTPKIDYAKQAELLALVDDVASQQMGGLLHHPDFQAAEAAWRAVHFLVHRLETDAHLKLYLLDIARPELEADLRSHDDLGATDTYRLLVEQTVGTPGAQPWSLLVGLYTFDANQDDAELLGRLAKIARQAEAPFLAGASSCLVGCAALAETPDPDDWLQPLAPEVARAWEAVRELPEASYLGLALPRFLLRLPYGKATRPTGPFRFEEMPTGSCHEEYLWGNPAIVCACLMAQAFGEAGWNFRPGSLQQLGGLPLHVYKEAGTPQAKPCAEVMLTMRAMEALVRKGLIPLLSIQGMDAVRVASFLSFACGATPLAGRWRTSAPPN